MKQTPALVP